MSCDPVTQSAVIEPLARIGRWADQFKAGEIDAIRFVVLVGHLLEDLASAAYGIRYER